jgi:hypothetical protein
VNYAQEPLRKSPSNEVEIVSLLELQGKLFELFEEGKYNDALMIAKTIEEVSPDMKYKTYFWRACLYSSLKEYSTAINELNSGLNEVYGGIQIPCLMILI